MASAYTKALHCFLAIILHLQHVTEVSAGDGTPCPIPSNTNAVCENERKVECNSATFESCTYDNMCLASSTHSEFNQETCCRVSMAFCMAQYDPVYCKGCKYSNMCHARDAGYDEASCTKTIGTGNVDEICPVNTGICMGNYDPVECTSKAVETCPVHTGICPELYDPVECTSDDLVCKYDNMCMALGAGYDETSCAKAIGTSKAVETCPMNQKQPCPKLLESVTCRKDANPQDKSCQYDNLCEAEGAGFGDDATCCRVNNLKRCPSRKRPVECRKDSEDQHKSCQYDNFCKARGAGYQKNECILVRKHGTMKEHECEEIPQFTQAACEGIEKTDLVCGPKKCEMDSVCTARNMKWNRKQCTQKDGCRLSRINHRCTGKDKTPVLCSESRCEYSNQCVASRGAGYKRTECVPKSE